MLGGIVLDDLGEVSAVTEALGNRRNVRAKAIARNLRAVDDPLPNIVDEYPRCAFVALASDVGDYRLAGRVQGNERILIALIRLRPLRAALLLADIAPNLIKFEDRHL